MNYFVQLIREALLEYYSAHRGTFLLGKKAEDARLLAALLEGK